MRMLAVPSLQRRRWRVLAILLLCAAAGLAHAQSAADDDSADPPSRVARLSYVAGDLGLQPAGATDWSEASVNRPLATGDRLSTGQDARAELELGGGTLRMAGETDVGLLDLDEQLAQVELTQGTLNLTVRELGPGQSYEIDTPTVALVIDQPGTFRVDIGNDGSSTQVTAFEGGATAYGENDARRTINPGRSYRFVDSSLAAVAINDIGGGDAFDAWRGERDRRYAASTTRQYVSDEVVGYQDLDQYGDWQDTSDYGAVWYPSHVGNDWAPYRDGHWAYIAPWGWTWMDDSPWGYAPYHYGRWAYTHRGWGWIPGPRGVRAVYAPALVAFVGGGSWSVGIGGAPVGWFPLGPGEFYNPWYHCGRNYYTRINRHNGRDGRGHDRRNDDEIHRRYEHFRAGRPEPDERYVNRNAPRGFTAVPGRTFADGRRVQRELLQVDPRKLAGARVSPHGVALRPVAGRAAPRSPHLRSLPANGFHREVVARHAPAVLHRPDAGNPDMARRIGGQVSNVRLLNPRGASQNAGLSRTDRGDTHRITVEGRALPPVARITPAREAASTPAVITGRPQATRRGGSVGPRRGELPPARFARRPAAGAPRMRNVDQSARMPAGEPRPGLSVISRADRSDARPVGRGLPRVQPIRRAMPADRPLPPARLVPGTDQRIQRAGAMRTMRNYAPMPIRRNAEPRIDNTARQPSRVQPRLMPPPVRTESIHNYQPRYQPTQRAATPLPAAARPQRAPSQARERGDHAVKPGDRRH